MIAPRDRKDLAGLRRRRRRAGITDQRRREELDGERGPAEVAAGEDARDARELGIRLQARRRVRPGAELLRPGRSEVRVGSELVRQIEDGATLVGHAAEPERSGQAGLGGIGLWMEGVAVLLAEELPHRVERLVTRQAGGTLRRMRLIEGREAGRWRGRLEGDRAAQRDDQRLVHGDPRLVAAVGVPFREKAGRGEEADAGRPQYQVGARAERGEIEHAGGALGGGRRPHRHHLPELRVGDGQRYVRGGKRGRLATMLTRRSRDAEPRGHALEQEVHRQRDRGLPCAAVVDDGVLRTERIVGGAGELRRVPHHVVGARRIERLLQRDRPLLRGERELESRIRLLEEIGRRAAVGHLHCVHERVHRHQARREHEPLRGGGGGERLVLLDQRDRGASEALAQVAEEARIEAPQRAVAELIAEVGGHRLALLESVGEERLELGGVLGRGDPLRNEPAQRFRIRAGGLDFRIAGREPNEQILHLAGRRGDARPIVDDWRRRGRPGRTGRDLGNA